MKEPERGGLKGIAGVLLSIFNEEIRQFLARKSVKFKRFGYRSREHILDYIWLLKDDLDASKSGGKPYPAHRPLRANSAASSFCTCGFNRTNYWMRRTTGTYIHLNN